MEVDPQVKQLVELGRRALLREPMRFSAINRASRFALHVGRNGLSQNLPFVRCGKMQRQPATLRIYLGRVMDSMQSR